MEINSLKISSADADRLASPLELDLIAYFNIALDAVSEKMETAIKAGWTPEQFIAEVDMLFDGTGDRISYADEFVEKGAGLPAGARRFWPSDQHWHRKLKDGGWLDEYDGHMSKPGANIGHRHQLNSAGGGNEKDAPRALGQKGKDDAGLEALPEEKAEELKAEEPKEKKPRAKREAKLYNGKPWVELGPQEKAKEDLERLRDEYKKAYMKKWGYNENDREIKDIDNFDEAKLGDRAKMFNKFRAKPKKYTEDDWGKMGFGERIRADRSRFIKQLLAEHDKKNGRDLNNRWDKRRHNRDKRNLQQYGDANLAEAAKNVLGRNPSSLPTDQLPKPKNDIPEEEWNKLGYLDQAAHDRQRLIFNILAARKHDDPTYDDKAGRRKYMKVDDANLARYAHRYMGAGKDTKERSAERIEYEEREASRRKKEAEEQKKRRIEQDERRAEQLKYAITKPEHYLDQPRESKLIDNDPPHTSVNKIGHINEVAFPTMKTISGGSVKAVWKPLSGENTKHHDVRGPNVPDKSQFIRERSGYVVNKIVGLDTSPVCVVRDVPGEGLGAMMERLDAEDFGKSGMRMEDIPTKEWQKLALHHWLVCHLDAHPGNYMVNKTKKELYPIDNGLSFPEDSEWGNFKGYRSRPHQYLVEQNALDLPAELKNLVTAEKRDKVLEHLDQMKYPQSTKDIIKKHFDYVINTGRLPKVDFDYDLFGRGIKGDAEWNRL
jgi:hypothetical protein